MKNWKLYLMSGAGPGDGLDPAIWGSAYKTWHSVWKEAFAELGEGGEVYSDEFTRQSSVLAVFEGDRCLLLLFFRDLDLSLQAHREDSYFKVWTDRAIEGLTRDSDLISVGSNTTVPKEFRGKYKNYSLKRVLVGLATKYLATHPFCSAMTGTMRNDKGMSKATVEEGGAQVLERNIKFHGVDVDLVSFYQKEIIEFNHEYAELIDALWESRWDHREPGTQRRLKIAA